MQYRITFADGRTQDVEGDDASVETTGAVVILRDVLVIGRPRRIVAARFSAGQGVQSVDLLQE